MKKGKRVIPVADDGWRFIIPITGMSALLILYGKPWAGIAGALGMIFVAFCLFFFRDFDRDTPMDDHVIYSPADGKVLGIETIQSADGAIEKIIRIFMSIFDVHVQRSPVEGHVESMAYKPGRFLDARNRRAHMENEQNELVINSRQGKVCVRQVAGLVARRILCWARVGTKLQQGERYGLIRFGSQVDLIVPETVEISVGSGEKVAGGKTVIGRWESKSTIVKCNMAENPRLRSN